MTLGERETDVLVYLVRTRPSGDTLAGIREAMVAQGVTLMDATTGVPRALSLLHELRFIDRLANDPTWYATAEGVDAVAAAAVELSVDERAALRFFAQVEPDCIGVLPGQFDDAVRALAGAGLVSIASAAGGIPIASITDAGRRALERPVVMSLLTELADGVGKKHVTITSPLGEHRGVLTHVAVVANDFGRAGIEITVSMDDGGEIVLFQPRRRLPAEAERPQNAPRSEDPR